MQRGSLLWGARFRRAEAVSCAGQVAQLPADERLVPKVHVNLGITLEADGRLLAACNHYQCAPDSCTSHTMVMSIAWSSIRHGPAGISLP